jgi:thiamine biosynthesis lipoprotein ApbE
VTVITSQGSSANALSTALFVMGATEGKRMIARMPGVSAIFVEQGTDDLVITTVGKVAGLTRLSH